jgi:hypothetical protein
MVEEEERGGKGERMVRYMIPNHRLNVLKVTGRSPETLEGS